MTLIITVGAGHGLQMAAGSLLPLQGQTRGRGQLGHLLVFVAAVIPHRDGRNIAGVGVGLEAPESGKIRGREIGALAAIVAAVVAIRAGDSSRP
ncbi:MAG TPA: hypothetical protein EYN66_15335 [Myxococcales bacterium]|nr:hypothetical protein [Myxococcales bacterium]